MLVLKAWIYFNVKELFSVTGFSVCWHMISFDRTTIWMHITVELSDINCTKHIHIRKSQTCAKYFDSHLRYELYSSTSAVTTFYSISIILPLSFDNNSQAMTFLTLTSTSKLQMFFKVKCLVNLYIHIYLFIYYLKCIKSCYFFIRFLFFP